MEWRNEEWALKLQQQVEQCVELVVAVMVVVQQKVVVRWKSELEVEQRTFDEKIDALYRSKTSWCQHRPACLLGMPDQDSKSRAQTVVFAFGVRGTELSLLRTWAVDLWEHEQER